MIKTAARWLFILCLPVLLLTASVSATVNCPWLYDFGFNAFGVGRTTGLAAPELDKAARGLIHYFNSDEENVSITVVKDGKPFQLFNEREVAHLRDVKDLFRIVYRLSLGTFLYSLAFLGLSLFLWKDRRLLARGLIGGGALTLLLMIVTGIGTLFNFDQLFWQFHLISFANDLWLLDPTRDYLIMLFPRDLWYAVFLFWALTTAVAALVLGGLGFLVLRRMRQKPA